MNEERDKLEQRRNLLRRVLLPLALVSSLLAFYLAWWWLLVPQAVVSALAALWGRKWESALRWTLMIGSFAVTVAAWWVYTSIWFPKVVRS